MSVKKQLEKLSILGATYHKNGWMPGTAGNLSVRILGESGFWVSGSGLDKNTLNKRNFLYVDLKSGRLSPSKNTKVEKGLKPSAETSIHRAVYCALDDIGCGLHVHTLESNLIRTNTSQHRPVALLELPAIEILKVYGIWEENPKVYVPVIYNFPNVQDISDCLESYLKEYKPVVPFCIIEKHGITVWGKDTVQANRNLEATDFILKYMISSRNLSNPEGKKNFPTENNTSESDRQEVYVAEFPVYPATFL
ncbi:methylthioribulose 1-phosphate dehydratase [Leptospira borgpetersenii]|uniref:methylthioribulose 1-phosphate dehydratase n=1 Tax=Leptospira borgpetersenii TaxID=174 RepID=UPI000774708B|nr:methylthioribulose 1-phosphate dehydratase [Leptospira borgpetersenii]MBE8365093.1 methylthioribulose 1-phosphate dehydratase [Leptospira borgpetersenii serovar Balcanica]MBE8367193.1 methylthioribulose 1-phosphate dehydratase [Leptospira borgpetersenii serovar Balcanica]MBE8400248.1 methylthioribulose 1-phosphate dehydratase [Leptospira borgpetersenii serovar Tarassovi]MBE8402415.1 methylthioribulose 1-phosphate dehydratase [Leptospira borgpetersenii serovar Tarassovi]MBE8405336.1 methylth